MLTLTLASLSTLAAVITPPETPYHAADAAKLEALLRATAPPPAVEKLRSALSPPVEIDVVVTGGALRGYFMLGARHALESRSDLVVRRYSGTSAGAWTALFMAAGLSSADWLKSYTLTQAVSRQAEEQGRAAPALMEAYRERLWPWLQEVLPEDAYERCSGRLFVTLTMIQGVRPRPVTISRFESNEDLFEACVASSCVPRVTQRGFGARFRGRRAFDGLFSDNVCSCALRLCSCACHHMAQQAASASSLGSASASASTVASTVASHRQDLCPYLAAVPDCGRCPLRV